jgi:2-dehydro-3-deoxygluconokinase
LRNPLPTTPPAVDAVTAGEAMVLLLAEPGTALGRAVSFRASVAGAETNVAVGLARLGHGCRWLGRVGADPFGEQVLRLLRAEGVDTSRVLADPGAPTGLLVRDSHPGRPIDVRYYRTGSAGSAWEPGDFDSGVLDGARLVHVSGITPMLGPGCRAATERLVEVAREAGAMVSIDPNVRGRLGDEHEWRDVVGPLLARADLVLAGADEVEMLTRLPVPAAVDGLLAGGVQTVVVKEADKSATAHRAGGLRWSAQPLHVRLADPVGAGDAFAAGYLSGVLDGLPPAECLRRGAAVAALAVQSPADIDGLPRREELDALLGGDCRAGGADVLR